MKKEEKPNMLDNTPIQEIFTERIANVLNSAGIETLGDLRKKTREDIANIDGIGITLLNRILGKLGELGITLKSISDEKITDNTELEKIGFSYKLKTTLLAAEIRTVGDLKSKSLEEIKALYGMGDRKISELIKKCNDLRIEFKTESIEKITDYTFIKKLGFSKRLTNALEKAGIIYVIDLKCRTIEEIGNMDGVGAKLLRELEEKCEELRIVLKDPKKEKDRLIEEINAEIKECSRLKNQYKENQVIE